MKHYNEVLTENLINIHYHTKKEIERKSEENKDKHDSELSNEIKGLSMVYAKINYELLDRDDYPFFKAHFLPKI